MQTTSTTTRRPTTTTTTTVRPRLFNYYEEGGWKILRQEEEKEKHKYDFLYHTENGIYGEEKAHLHPGAGTAASGYYEYTGDDGELYRVNYKSDHRGFIPEGDHIPTPPPVPDAIKRALEYVAKKKETHGVHQSGQYEHKSDPIRLQNMPTIDRPLNQQQQIIPQTKIPLPTLLPTFGPIGPQPRFIQYSGNNQYSPLPTIAPQNAAQRAYLAPSLLSRRPADQLIQQTQLAQQSQPEQLPQVQVLLPQVQVQKPVEIQPIEIAKPVEVVQQVQLPIPAESPKPALLPQQIALSSPVLLPQQEVKVVQPITSTITEVRPKVEEEQMQSDQPQEDRIKDIQPQISLPQPIVPEVLPKEEIPVIEEQSIEKDQQLQADQSVESVVFVMPDKTEIEAKIEPSSKNHEVSPEASEQDNAFQPPYQVPEKLKDESNFELTTA